MKKNLLKVITVVLALCFCCGSIGCNNSSGGGGGGNGDTTVISVLNMGGGVGRAWLDQAFERFSKTVENKSYETGKTGVSMEVEHTTKYTVDDIDTAGYNIYFDQGQANIQQFAAQNKILNINDIVTEGGDENSIESRISGDYRSALQYNGEYYALPHYEIFGGLTYDVEMFEDEDMFIAAPGETNVEEYVSTFGYTVNFALEGAKRSCGNDGKPDTADDGLPSSLVELLVLCDKIASKGWSPFAVAGSHVDYAAYFLTGLEASLSGYNAMRAGYTFNGEIEVVTGFSETEDLFTGLDQYGVSLPKPITEKINVTEATGYQVRNRVGRYYALAMLDIFEKAGWFNKESYSTTTLHTTTQDKFIFSGEAGNNYIGMLMEGSQWINEAIDSGSLANFYTYTGRSEETAERNIAWMSLPTQVYEPVEEDKGHETVVVDMTPSFAFINANIRSEGLVQACKDFLKFLYQEDELKAFVGVTGVTRSGIKLDYGDDILGNLNSLQRSVVSMASRDDVKVVSQNGDNDTFRLNRTAFVYAINGAMYSSVWGGVSYYTPLRVFRRDSLSYVTGKDIFEQTLISEATWLETYYQG